MGTIVNQAGNKFVQSPTGREKQDTLIVMWNLGVWHATSMDVQECFDCIGL